METGTIKHGDADGVVQWQIEEFTALEVDSWYYSPQFSFAGGEWRLWIGREDPEGGQRIDLSLDRREGGPRTLDVAYTFSVRDRDGDRHAQQRNRKEFRPFDDSPEIPIELEEERMSDLVPDNRLTVLCHIDPTRGAGGSATSDCSYCGGAFDAGSISSHQGKCLDKPIQCPECSHVLLLRNWHECHSRSAQEAAQLKEELLQKTGELVEKQSELIRLRRLIEELNLKVTNLQADRDNAQKLLQTKNNSQLKKELEQKSADLDCVKEELGNKQFELNKWKRLYEELILKTIDTEISRENLQSLRTSGTQSPLTSVTETYDFAHDFNHFLEEKTDVTFVLETPDGKKEFFAHRFVLARKSSYFADKFREKQRNEEEQLILLKNISPKAFKDMIRYCYDWEPCLRTIEETCALLEVAFHFKVMSLVNVCQAFLRDAEIEPRNVLSLLLVSRKTEDKGLAEKCNKFLQDKTREVIESYELRNVTPSMVRAILDLPMLSLCSEYDLLEWIFEWAKVKSQENGCGSVREYLENLLKDLNFLALTLEEFVTLCKNNQGFFSSTEFQSISMNIASPGSVDMPDWYDKDLRFRAYTLWKPKNNIVLNNKRND